MALVYAEKEFALAQQIDDTRGKDYFLSLSYDMIKAQGGDILVNNEEGEGAEFIIHLPIKEQTEA